MIKSLSLKLLGRYDKDIITLFGFQGFNMIAALLFGKLTATHISPDVFGTYNLIISLIAFLTSFFFTPFVYSYRFEFNKVPYSENLNFYGSLLLWVWMIGAGAVFAGVAIWQPSGLILALWAVLLVFFQYFQEFHAAILNLESRHLRYSFIALFISVVSLSLLFVQTFIWGRSDITTLFTAVIISQFAGLILSLFSKKANLGFRVQHLRDLFGDPKISSYFQYVKPLIALPIFTWVLNQGDKFILLRYWGAKEVGLYAAAYGLGSKVFIAFNAPLILYFNPKIYRLSAQQSTLSELYALTLKIVKIYLAAGAVIVFLVFAFHRHIGLLLLSEAYSESFKVIPVISLAFLFMTASNFIDQNFYARGLTFLLLRVFLFTAIVNLIINAVLVPGWGITGAAVAMAAATLFQLLFQLFQFRLYCKPAHDLPG